MLTFTCSRQIFFADLNPFDTTTYTTTLIETLICRGLSLLSTTGNLLLQGFRSDSWWRNGQLWDKGDLLELTFLVSPDARAVKRLDSACEVQVPPIGAN